MTKNIGVIRVLAPLMTVMAVLWLYRPASGQNRQTIPQSSRQAAAAMLDSSAAEFISGAGLTALGILSGRIPLPAASSSIRAVPGVTPFAR